MGTFTREELVSATKLAKNFGSYSQKLRDGELKKIGVLKNNELDMTIIPNDLYDFFEDLVENIEIYKEVATREKEEDFVDADEVLSQFDLGNVNAKI